VGHQSRTRRRLEEIIDALYAYARERGYQMIAIGSERVENPRFIIQHAGNFVEIALDSAHFAEISSEQGMGSDGRISPGLIAWLEQNHFHYQCDGDFSQRACAYLLGQKMLPPPPVLRLAWQMLQSEAGTWPSTADLPWRIRGLLSAQPAWFAVYANPPEISQAFEMRPIIGWALVEDAAGMSEVDKTGLVAIYVRSDEESGSETDADPHFVLNERSGFLGYAFPGCEVDWQQRADWVRETAYDEIALAWKD
jgi:hypothetical protein